MFNEILITIQTYKGKFGMEEKKEGVENELELVALK